MNSWDGEASVLIFSCCILQSNSRSDSGPSFYKSFPKLA